MWWPVTPNGFACRWYEKSILVNKNFLVLPNPRYRYRYCIPTDMVRNLVKRRTSFLRRHSPKTTFHPEIINMLDMCTILLLVPWTNERHIVLIDRLFLVNYLPLDEEKCFGFLFNFHLQKIIFNQKFPPKYISFFAYFRKPDQNRLGNKLICNQFFVRDRNIS